MVKEAVTRLLPGVMGIEAFAETAALLFPDLKVAAVEDVELLAPFKLYRDEPRTLESLGQELGHAVLDGSLVARDARDPDELAEHGEGRGAIPGVLAAWVFEQVAGALVFVHAPRGGCRRGRADAVDPSSYIAKTLRSQRQSAEMPICPFA